MTPTPFAYPDPPLADAVVILRPWRVGDAACVEEGLNVARYDAARWIERQWRRTANGEGISLAIAAASSDEAIGYAGLILRPRLELGTIGSVSWHGADGELGLVFRPQVGAGIGYWVVERARRRGLASHAVGLLARWALLDAGLERVEALLEPDNIGSRRVAERAGFQHEGCLRRCIELDGRHRDALVYSLVRDDVEVA